MLFSLYLVNKDKICNVTNMISFLIPSHNYGNFLKKCVKSIIKNNPKYIKEIIIVNDASSDNTDQIIKELKKENIIRGEKIDFKKIKFLRTGKKGINRYLIEKFFKRNTKYKSNLPKSTVIQFKHFK